MVYAVHCRKLKRWESELDKLKSKIDALDPNKQKYKNVLDEILKRPQ